jgi:hypothetical protein
VTVFRLRWSWVLLPLALAYVVVLPLLFLLLDLLLGLAGGRSADPWLFLGAVALGTAAVVLNARGDKLVLDGEGLRLSEGETPLDVLAPWSSVESVRRVRRGPLRLDQLQLRRARLVRREPRGLSALRGPLRERAFERERERRRRRGPATVTLSRYSRGGWDGPLGEIVRRHRPDLVLDAADRAGEA